jgi:hypothetical protein
VGATVVTGNLAHYPEAIRVGVAVLSPSSYLKSLK